ncbi:MAG: T9SS type A sorting domain-containing protein [bacterium]|nr:MAG: T9SS type A sorting domain-containing protein [bacterium]
MNRPDSLDRLPFELAYLALLTTEKLKPLSRWESSLEQEQIDVLRGCGLDVMTIDRSTMLRRLVPRVIFSTSRRLLEAYHGRFNGRRLRHSPGITKVEGWFFGYPSCCVERFVEKPYTPNGLSPGDQRILFHWACPGCHETELLLRDYRSLYRECVAMFGGSAYAEELECRFTARPRYGRIVRTAIPWAASLAALAVLPGLGGALQNDPHWLPAPDDIDGDGLAYAEEILFGRTPSISDSDNNGVIDGVDEGLALSALIAALPRTPQVGTPYAIEYLMDGVEQCTVCSTSVNMGYLSIIHPDRGVMVDVPFIALHYLEHGSIGYDGTLHVGRVDIDRLKRILFPENPAHFVLNAVVDSDGDQLEDLEEPLLSCLPSVPDTDGDGLFDGPQVCERLLKALSTLPREPHPDEAYLIEHLAFGFETCNLCGEQTNMGFAEIVNPIEEITMELPFIALHYLAHGSLGYDGDIHSGRTLPVILDAVLRGDGGAHHVSVAVPDTDGDGLTDYEEMQLGLEYDNPDSDGDGIHDGPDVSMVLYDVIERLPEGPLADEVYKIHTPMRGDYQCLVCGEQINMGYMEIVNPVAGTSTPVSYYNHHFLKNGCCSTDRPFFFPRLDILELVDVLGVTIADAETTPRASLLVNAPNPFESNTEISFSLPEEQDVVIKVFDVAGRKVQTIYTGQATRGRNTYVWDGRDSAGKQVASGVYFCTLETGSFLLKRKILKLR